MPALQYRDACSRLSRSSIRWHGQKTTYMRLPGASGVVDSQVTPRPAPLGRQDRRTLLQPSPISTDTMLMPSKLVGIAITEKNMCETLFKYAHQAVAAVEQTWFQPWKDRDQHPDDGLGFSGDCPTGNLHLHNLTCASLKRPR